MPLFSFIIPVYNVSAYLPKCLDSILRQNIDDWEAILIDDGSVDNSGKICDEYAAKDDRFKVFHKANGGVSSARNVGLENARGEWIWFVDSDDWIENNALSTLFDVIKTYSCDTIFFGMRIENHDSSTNLEQPSLSKLSCESFLSQISCFANPTMLFSHDIIREHLLRFPTGIKMAEDLEFQYKYLTFIKSPVSINSMLYVYMRRDDSAMNNPNTHITNYKDCLKVANNLSEFIKLQQIPYSDWLMIRIRQIIKSAMQSAPKVDGVIPLKNDLQNVIGRFDAIGWDKIKDFTIRLALFNQNLYFFLLRTYKLLKR